MFLGKIGYNKTMKIESFKITKNGKPIRKKYSCDFVDGFFCITPPPPKHSRVEIVYSPNSEELLKGNE